MTLTVLLADDHAMLRSGLRAIFDTQPDLHCVAEVADGLQQIVARDPATTAQRTIVREDVNLFDPVLSPDGARIAYYRCCFAYNSPLVVRDFASGKVAEIGYGRGLPRWSPDGRYLAVTEDQRARFPTVIYDTINGAGVHVMPGVVAWLP